MSRNYESIINLPHYTSVKHERLSRESRAAQFSPFAALTGYEDEIEETARLTDSFKNIEEYMRGNMDETLQSIINDIASHPIVKLSYFVPDRYKEGGVYVEYEAPVRRIDEVNREIIFEGGKVISLDSIYSIQIKTLGID